MAGQKNNGALELWIGACVIGGIILVAAMIFMLGSGGGMFSKTYPVLVSMKTVGALRTGAPIQLGGIKIGKVGTIALNPETGVIDITSNINYDIRLPVDSTAQVSTMGIVGDSFLEITRGQSKDLVKREDDPVNAPHIDGVAGGDVAKVMAKVTEVGDDVKKLLENLNDVLNDDKVRASLKNSIINIDAITVTANQLLTDIRGVVAHIDTSVVHIKDMTETLNTTAAEVRAVSERIRKTSDEILSDANIATINGTVASVRQVAAGAQRAIERFDNILAAVPPERVTQLLDTVNETIGKAGTLADKGGHLLDAVDVDAVNRGIADAGAAIKRMSEVLSKVDPADVGAIVNRLKSSMEGVQEFITGVKNDIVLALSVNKAADRIVEKKFKEMGRDGVVEADRQMEVIRRWFNEGMKRGYLPDPAYPDPSKAPYNQNLPTAAADR